MAFFNANGKPITEVNVNVGGVKKMHVLYLDPAEEKELVDFLHKDPNALSKIRESILYQLATQ